jgi:DNA-binding beta-propeller fold protein YncE
MARQIWSRTMMLALLVAAFAAWVGSSLSGRSLQGRSQTSGAAAAQREKGGQEEFGPYEVVENWPQPLPDGDDGVKHDGWTWGSVGAVFPETPDRIWIAQRGELPLPPNARPWTPYGMLRPPRVSNGNTDGLSATCQPTEKRGWERRWHHVIFVVDRNGKMIDWWKQHDQMFGEIPCGRGPHKIKISPYDPQKHVWIIDDQVHVVYKFTYDGKLVQTLGTKGQKGRDGGRLFDRPTDIAWLPDGTFFISDGYGGTRVAKFDKDGKFLLDWGKAAADASKPGPNEFNNVHAVAVGRDRRVYVADRGHSRIQVFDENGKFADMWEVRRPLDLFIAGDQSLWVSDLDTSRILKYDLSGHYQYGWGTGGSRPGNFNCAHSIAVDQERNFYIGECFGGRVQKFRPKPNADPAKVVAPPAR